ncbi:hypothetical protein VTH06DRAFT_5283 [Thermothelomyces fergusii]
MASTSTKANCPVVGTTNTTLPPSHPDIDLSKPGQVCPVVGATTDHHAGLLHKHPAVPIPAGRSPSDASACPVVRGRLVEEEKSRAMDDGARSEASWPGMFHGLPRLDTDTPLEGSLGADNLTYQRRGSEHSRHDKLNVNRLP